MSKYTSFVNMYICVCVCNDHSSYFILNGQPEIILFHIHICFRFRGQIDENNPSQRDQIFAQQVVQKLIAELESRAVELPQQNEYFLLRIKFQDVAHQFRTHYAQNPMELVRIFKRNLAMEESLLRQHENVSVSCRFW